jgi:hypothetical protein
MTLLAQKHPILHVINAAASTPLIAWVIGSLQGVVAALAALAALILYSLQIYDWIRHRKDKA